MEWLEPVREAVRAATRPVRVFFRDDDAGWDDERLFDLLDLFEARGVPIDLAVIPQALKEPLARELRTRRANAPSLLGLHQHGFSHENHQREGRKCEFGSARSCESQREDIAHGLALLDRLLGWTDLVFTPPWNRCAQATVDALIECGFTILSRDARAQALSLGPLLETPVCVDWCKGAGAAGTRLHAIAQRTAAAVRAGGPVGVMLHHAVMDASDRSHLEAMLGALGELPNVHCVPLREAARASRPQPLPGA